MEARAKEPVKEMTFKEALDKFEGYSDEVKMVFTILASAYADSCLKEQMRIINDQISSIKNEFVKAVEDDAKEENGENTNSSNMDKEESNE